MLTAYEAPGGWNAALPNPPKVKSKTNIQNEPAKPIDATKTPDISGPATAKILRPFRSAKYPNIGCGSADAIEKLTDKVAAIAIDNPRLSMILGRSGGTKEAYASLRP